MKNSEKKQYLVTKYWAEWASTRHRVELDLAYKQPMVCCCGRLATGMHERSCRRFQSRVDSATIKELRHLCAKQPTPTTEAAHE